MKSTYERTQPGKVKFSICVSVNDCEVFFKKKAADIAKTISIPGFRAGHVPYDVIKRHVGEMHLMNEALQDIVRSAYRDAVAEHKIKVAMPPIITVTKCAPGNDIEFTAEVVTIPHVTLPSFAKTTVTKKATEVTEGDVDATLQELRVMRGKEKIKEGGAEIGDSVEVNIETYTKDTKEVIDSAKGQKIVLDDKALEPIFLQHLLGIRKGESKEFAHTLHKEYERQEFAGKEVEVKVFVLEVWQTELPELDDAFAHEVSPACSNLAALKVMVCKNIIKERDMKEEQRVERALLEDIIAHAQFEESAKELVVDTQKQLQKEVRASIEQYGTSWADYLAHIKKTEEDVERELEGEALRRIKIDAVIAEVITQGNIQVSDKEVEEEANRFLSTFASVKQAKEEIDVPRLVASISGRLLNRKAIEFLKSKVTIQK